MAYKAKRFEEGRYALRFEIRHGDEHMLTTVLNQPVIKVGNLSSSGLKLEWDDKVSRMHAVIEVHSKEDLSVIDLGSRYGTFVNDEKVNKADVKLGDRMRFGDTIVRVLPADGGWDDEEPPSKSEKPPSKPESPPSKPDRMNLTECLDWAHKHDVRVHFSSEGVVYAWIDGTKVKGVTLRDAINILRDYSSE
jgi:hypothetical protein